MPAELIDLDAQATSPLAREALAAMLPYLEGQHWNPSSAHRGGRIARAAVEAARVQVAALLGADPVGLLFTSGATEANNLALKGVMERASRPRLVTFATEHSCVLAAVAQLAARGTPTTILPVRPDGLPDLDAYAGALGPDVALVSAMAINNEIGAIWPVARMAAMAQAAGALFHTDAAQAFGKIDLRETGADLISLSAHKMHGPKGIGALWVRPGVELAPQLDGGGQEGGIRSGTQAPALAAGFGAAARQAKAGLEADAAVVRARMDEALTAFADVVHRINGPDPRGPDRWPGNLSISFPGVDAGRLISRLPGLALSSGSACSSGSNRPSHVLGTIGLAPEAVRQTLRLGWNATMTEPRFKEALMQLVEAVRALQPMRVAS